MELTSSAPDLIGLVPAAGTASRVAPLPGSKELFPVGFRRVDGELRPKTVSHYLLERMAAAGVGRACVVLRDGKWDVPAYYGAGQAVGMDLAYLLVRRTHGVPFTIDDAYAFTRGSTVVFGFPDIVYWPEDALSHLVERHRASGSDIVVAVVPTRRPEKEDLVDVDPTGQIVGIQIKTPGSSLTHTWMLAVWGPRFTEFLHEFVNRIEAEVAAGDGRWRGRELYVGDVLWEAIENGLSHETVVFEDGGYIDIGTPEELAHAVRSYAEPPGHES